MYGFGPNYEKRILHGYKLSNDMKIVESGCEATLQDFGMIDWTEKTLDEIEIFTAEADGEYLFVLTFTPTMPVYKPPMRLKVILCSGENEVQRTIFCDSTYTNTATTDSRRRTGGFPSVVGALKVAKDGVVKMKRRLTSYQGSVWLMSSWTVYRIS